MFNSESKLFRVRGFSIELCGFCCMMLLLFLSSVCFAFCAECTHSEVAEYIHLLKLEHYFVSHQTYSDNSPHGNAVALLGAQSGWSISGISEVCHAISSLNTLTAFQVFIFTEILPENFLCPGVSVQLLRKALISNGDLDKPFYLKR